MVVCFGQPSINKCSASEAPNVKIGLPADSVDVESGVTMLLEICRAARADLLNACFQVLADIGATASPHLVVFKDTKGIMQFGAAHWSMEYELFFAVLMSVRALLWLLSHDRCVPVRNVFITCARSLRFQ